MSRSAKEANAAIFDRLISYAADHDVYIPVGERRIHLDEADYNTFIATKRTAGLRLGRHQAAALLQTPQGELLALAGFKANDIDMTSHIHEAELSPGITVALLMDLEIEPAAGPSKVLDVVAAGSMEEVSYPGHDVLLVQGLFSQLRVMEVDAAVAGAPHFAANLLTVCAAESMDGNGWINRSLAVEIVRLGDQRIPGFPYEFLVRAVLDLDPVNLFLALYRCLESTYAFKRASELSAKLGITDKSWIEVARAVGESLSWYPRHDQSLSSVLSLPAVSKSDLAELAASLGKNEGRADEVPSRVASGIRDLRNSLVHYGPTTKPATVPNDDWNQVCIPLARIVGSVFSHTYGGLPASAMEVSDPGPKIMLVSPERASISRLVRSTRKLAGRIFAR